MVIELVAKDGYEKKDLKFKALVDNEYVIVSKEEAEPYREGPSKFAAGTDAKWYVYNLTVHEYEKVDMTAMTRTIEKPNERVGYMTNDNVYDEDTENPRCVPGTVLKALRAANVGQKIKITMVEGAKQRKYATEIIEEAGTTPSPSASEPVPTAQPVEAGVNPALKTMIDGLKMANLPIDTVIATVQGQFPGVTPEEITAIYTGENGVQ